MTRLSTQLSSFFATREIVRACKRPIGPAPMMATRVAVSADFGFVSSLPVDLSEVDRLTKKVAHSNSRSGSPRWQCLPDPQRLRPPSDR